LVKSVPVFYKNRVSLFVEAKKATFLCRVDEGEMWRYNQGISRAATDGFLCSESILLNMSSYFKNTKQEIEFLYLIGIPVKWNTTPLMSV